MILFLKRMKGKTDTKLNIMHLEKIEHLEASKNKKCVFNFKGNDTWIQAIDKELNSSKSKGVGNL